MLLRKCQGFCVALLALCVVMPVPSWALGLGEIEVDSALNERFSGTIGLLDADGFQPAEIVVSMASREDFERVGVDSAGGAGQASLPHGPSRRGRRRGE